MPNIYAVEIAIPIGMEAGFAYSPEYERIYIQAYEPQQLYNMLGYLITAMIDRQAVVGERYMDIDREESDWFGSSESDSSEDQETLPSILLPRGVSTPSSGPPPSSSTD